MSNDRIEKTILQNLIYNENYTRKVFPFLKPEYFTDPVDNQLFITIGSFIDKYNKCPSKEAIEIELQGDKRVGETVYAGCVEDLATLEESLSDADWLRDTTEKFCKDKALLIAISQAIQIIDGVDKKFVPEAIPTLLQEALAVAFNTNIGHDYFEQMEERFDFYNSTEERIPFALSMLNKVTKGGVPKKTLSCFLAPTGAGKTAFMTDWASYLISLGYNVLYVTAEMAEERIAERNDANLLDIPIDQLKTMAKPTFISRLKKLFEKNRGRLIIKEYPTSSAHAGHIDMLLNELKIKKNFIPDIIFVDYLNIMVSQRFKAGAGANSYTIVKSIAEELRGLAVRHNLPVITATQVNRAGFDNSDIDMTETSESIGLPATLDFYAALIPTEELEKLGQLMVKLLKNRFGSITHPRRFAVGIDRSRMKLYDLDETAQNRFDKDDQEKQEDKQGYQSKNFSKLVKESTKGGSGKSYAEIKF